MACTCYFKRCTVVSHIYAYDRAKTLSFISLIRRKNTEFENECLNECLNFNFFAHSLI